ncbi:hypothetical protein LPJ76_004701, partial [Coemansia sp. RSA 638]
MFNNFFDKLAKRDEKWRDEQALRDEIAQYKREKELNEWREDQAKRDKDWREEQAKRDDEFKEWREKQEKRDDEFKEWREKQEKRDDEFKEWRDKQSEILEKLHAASTSGVRGAQAAPSTPVLTTPRLPFMSPSSVPRYLQEAQPRGNSGASAY